MARHRDEDEEVVVVEKHGHDVAPFLWGLAIGAALGLLLAPMSGKELRGQIAQRGRKFKDLAGEKLEEMEEMVSSGYDKARARVEEGLSSAKSKVQEGRQFAHDVTDAGRAAAGTAREELERRLAEAREARRAGRQSGDEEPVA
jgi:gas vesicle protein